MGSVALVSNAGNGLIEFDYSFPVEETQLNTLIKTSMSLIKFELEKGLWVWYEPCEYRICKMYEKTGRSDLKEVNALCASIMLGFAWDWGKNKWIPVNTAVFAGERKTEGVSTFYKPHDHYGLSEDHIAKIRLINNLLIAEQKERGLNLKDYRAWEEWNPYASFPDLGRLVERGLNYKGLHQLQN